MLKSSLYDSLGLASSPCSSSRFLPLQQHHQLAAHPLHYCKIKKSHNARATLDFMISRLLFTSWVYFNMFALLDSIKNHVSSLDETASVQCTSSALKGAQPPHSKLHHPPSIGRDLPAYPHPTRLHSTDTTQNRGPGNHPPDVSAILPDSRVHALLAPSS